MIDHSEKQHLDATGSETARARMRADTRRRLVEAGGRALAETGLDGIRTSSVARSAGVANGTVYLHFPDRESLVEAVVTTALSELAKALRQVRSAESPLWQTDRAAIEAIVGCAEQNRDIVVGALRAYPLEAGAELFTELLAQRRAELDTALDKSDPDEPVDTEVLVRAEFGALTGTLIWWMTEDTVVPREKLIDSLAEIVSRMSNQSTHRDATGIPTNHSTDNTEEVTYE